MIIEGRHADVGSGIFISDIQPESVAEQVNFMFYPIDLRPSVCCFDSIESLIF